MKRIILLIIPIILISGCVWQQEPIEEITAENECTLAGGIWLQRLQECENVTKEWCEEQSGQFNECASACRHEPAGTICTLQCIPLCSWRTEKNTEAKIEEKGIEITEPVYGAIINSPLTVKGRATGTWFFEGDFPVELIDSDGNVIATSFVTAEGEWMTEDFVDFTGTIQFESPKYEKIGVLRFKKDNPSGLQELDEEFDVPIKF